MRKQWMFLLCILSGLHAMAQNASTQKILYKINTAWTDEAAFEASADRPQGYTWNKDAFGSLKDATAAVGTGSQTFEFTHACDAWMTLDACSLKGFASVAVTQNAKSLANFNLGEAASAEFGIAAEKPVVIAVTTAKDSDAYVLETRTADVTPNSGNAVNLTPAAAGETASATGHVGYRTGAVYYEVNVQAGKSGIYTFAVETTDSYLDAGDNLVAYGKRGYVSTLVETADGKTVADLGDVNTQARRAVELAEGTYIVTVDSMDGGEGAENASFLFSVTAGKVNEGVTLGDNSMEGTTAVLTLAEDADGARAATLSGFVGLGDDQDWLLLENVESGYYNLTFDTLEGADKTDPVHGAHIYLYKVYTPEDGVARRKIVADTVFRGTAVTLKGILLDAAKTYYVQILCPGGFASANDATYTLTLQETESIVGLSNADDSWKAATTMTPATTFSEYVGGEDSCDWYMLDLDSSKTWKGRLDITREEGVLFIEIGSRKADGSLDEPKTEVTYQLRDDDPFQKDLEFDAGNDYFIRFHTPDGNDTRYEAKFSLLFYLKYTLAPDVATWTVDGTAHASGETTILVAGNYEVTFSDVQHFVTPAPETVALNKDKTLTKAYDAGYTISYTLSPDTATWTVDGTTYASGETTRTMLPGSYQVTFSDVPHFVTPDPETVSLNADLTINKAYDPGYTLSYTLTPASATWTLNGKTYTSGETTRTMLPGSYQVTFSEVTHFVTPDAETVNLNADLVIDKAYDPGYTLSYTLTPDTATWTLNGKTYDSGETTKTMLQGNYQVTFSDADGYVTPDAETVVLDADKTIDKAYTPLHNLTYTLTPSSAKWKVNGSTYASGTTVPLPQATYTVTFTDVENYLTPSADTVDLTADTTKSKTYTPMCKLTYTLTPNTAKWTIDGKTTYASGETATLSPNTYVVTFSDEWGYVKQDFEVVHLTQNTNRTVNYTDAPYLMVDLSAGPSAASYTCNFWTVGPDLAQDTCRTTQLWLRKIPAGTFTMGSPESELGHQSNETQHQVTLTKDYYIGVFECTQRQWELVMDKRPSYFINDSYYATRPVEQVSYGMIRGTQNAAGAGWPTYGHKVDTASFMGKLQARTSLVMDLPTEAQWEYACRKRENGTCWSTALNSGKDVYDYNTSPELAEVARYPGNSDANNYYNKSNYDTSVGTAKVGSYEPSELGLYDMHGNVAEWCLDWFDFNDYGTAAATDPKGDIGGTKRMQRGGSWMSNVCSHRAAYRVSHDPSDQDRNVGLRIVCHHP